VKRSKHLRATKPLRRRAPIRTSKEKRTGRRDTGPSRDVRELVLERDDYTCACCGHSVLYGPYSLQHRVARGMGGTSDQAINRPSNLVTLCGSATSPGGCHLACEKRDPILLSLGFWLRRNEDPAQVPVAHAVHGWAFLLDDGTVRHAGGVL
jgi:5-methylcytosine-specific restriction protein A